MNWVLMPYVDNLVMTQQALFDVLDQGGLADLQVLAVDNGSRSRELPIQDDPRVHYWHFQPALLSLATVWNTALDMVWGTGADHALVVNNDVRLPYRIYADLLEVQQCTEAWFVSACNVGEAWYPGMLRQSSAITESLLASRGGPDFSCYLMTRECHTWFRFDEQFIPAYHEDNDYHRRLQLAGFGDKIFSVPIPYLHFGSGTLRNVEHVNQGWGARFTACQEYYVRKWGGLPGHETYTTPFNGQAFSGPGRDPRCLLFAQGRNELGLKEYEEIRLELYGQAE
jgi:hypothetical protein